MPLQVASPWLELLGGGLIGLAATLLLTVNRRVMGISGILSGVLSAQGSDLPWRFAFLGGLVAVGFIAQHWLPGHVAEASAGTLTLGVAGLLVGAGTTLGGGCTSGHGVCGISRGATRSVVATLTFMTLGVATVTLLRRFEVGL